MSQLPSKETKSCEWRITAEKGSTIALNITRLVLKAGWIRIASGTTAFLTLLKPGPEPKYPWKFKSEGNVITVELLSYPDASGASHRNTYLSARYEQIESRLLCLIDVYRKILTGISAKDLANKWLISPKRQYFKDGSFDEVFFSGLNISKR